MKIKDPDKEQGCFRLFVQTWTVSLVALLRSGISSMKLSHAAECIEWI